MVNCPRGLLSYLVYQSFESVRQLVEQELLTLPEHLSSPPVFSGVRVTRSLILYVCFVDRCLSFCTFSFGHCVVCSSSIYGFWLPLWYLQTPLLTMIMRETVECYINVVLCWPLFVFLSLLFWPLHYPFFELQKYDSGAEMGLTDRLLYICICKSTRRCKAVWIGIK